MDILTVIKERARQLKRHVVFPEGEEPRTIEAAGMLTEQGIATVTLLGQRSVISQLLEKQQTLPETVTIITPGQSDKLTDYAKFYLQMRQEKAINLPNNLNNDETLRVMSDPLYFGAMMVATGDADASVAGAISTTGDVLRSAVRVVGLKNGIKIASSCFLMSLPSTHDAKVADDCLLFADCAIIPNPDADQLVSIALSAAYTWRCLTDTEPRLALLSFSTKGSARHPDVDKVLKALEILRRDHPKLIVDGELQVDAALIPEVSKRKAPGSAVAGKANVLIFPNLDAGNIGYKLVERLAGGCATGPLIMGLAKPVYDLSRGCSPQDIVDVAAIASIMAGSA